MSQLRVSCFSLSLDGFAAGPAQSLENPIGVGGLEVHEWMFRTETFRRSVLGEGGGETGVDDDFVTRGFENIGAWIIGRNMFGAERGPWRDDSWKGWWGDSPPFHAPVFVLTQHARDPIEMAGGTTFHFVNDGIHAALGRGRDAAHGMDVRLGGGVATIQQYLRAQLVDELHLAITPVLLGEGERLFSGVDMRALGYQCVERIVTDRVIHVVLKRET
ncbi:dihydrofolate reductase family protein [Halomonas sp. ANAO-440]|uniref:dihydrofolate reductase family protein n=1 Tax=Halomonas sp. ANAO-440 TaxID=2861360 RepID=UPI001CAA5664|nr:dihydrofolate reductase family protein [Halomonas sp. ANAO-440]MBZ0331402.1 dihydrofolate reductase family protein [Halomonas sp. ANAO-440]